VAREASVEASATGVSAGSAEADFSVPLEVQAEPRSTVAAMTPKIAGRLRIGPSYRPAVKAPLKPVRPYQPLY
jgi:hypothetical protein